MTWTPFKNVLSLNRPAATDAQSLPGRDDRSAVQGRGPGSETASLSLDSIGQRDEVIRQRINAMLDRLDDMRSLKDDFASILEPLVQISDELPRASMRVAELEASLGQERHNSGAARQDAEQHARRLGLMGSELSDALARADKAEFSLQDRESALAEHAIALRDKLASVENLERQLYGEVEQNKALMGESKALRLEAQAADSALSRSEHDLLTARERLGILEQDNRRLQVIGEEQSARLNELMARHKELEIGSDAERQKLHTVEAQFAAEITARERADAQHDVEVGSFRTERTGLMMKLESVENRAATAEQLLAQSRSQLREKDEAHRSAERSLKEAAIARATAERRVESLQADVARQSERFLDMQRARTELDSRCGMLNKALAAKDAAIEQAAARNTSLSDRLDELTRKHENARAELEIAGRRLAEDLENERSERALVQGALDIARESRIALQKQHEALKRSGRGWREVAKTDDEGDKDDASNVHHFTSPAKLS